MEFEIPNICDVFFIFVKKYVHFLCIFNNVYINGLILKVVIRNESEGKKIEC